MEEDEDDDDPDSDEEDDEDEDVDPDEDDDFDDDRLSVLWKPLPLNTMPTGANTRFTRPPQPGCLVIGSSLIDWYSSKTSPHFVQR